MLNASNECSAQQCDLHMIAAGTVLAYKATCRKDLRHGQMLTDNALLKQDECQQRHMFLLRYASF
jgi:hypothetical protein